MSSRSTQIVCQSILKSTTGWMQETSRRAALNKDAELAAQKMKDRRALMLQVGKKAFNVNK
jgi:hypothetical protein